MILEMSQAERWFSAVKEALDRKDYGTAWSWANQGQLYTQQIIRRETKALEVKSKKP